MTVSRYELLTLKQTESDNWNVAIEVYIAGQKFTYT